MSKSELSELHGIGHGTWLFAILRELSTRPGMYLGSLHVRSLANYLTGYATAREDLGVSAMPRAEADLWDAFGQWLGSKIPNPGNWGWCEIVEALDPSERSVETFFRLLREFLASRGTPLESLTGGWPPWTAPASVRESTGAGPGRG
jgi:hypothetical protein